LKQPPLAIPTFNTRDRRRGESKCSESWEDERGTQGFTHKESHGSTIPQTLATLVACYYQSFLLKLFLSISASPPSLPPSLSVAVLVKPTSSDFLRSPDFSCATFLSTF
jgi:hypothetical protein